MNHDLLHFFVDFKQFLFIVLAYTCMYIYDVKVGSHVKKVKLRRPRVELGSIAWKATMLTATPPTLT